jgi:hypothetical protein
VSVEERAKALVGDMPWVTDRLLSFQIEDLWKQIAAFLSAAVAERAEAAGDLATECRNAISLLEQGLPGNAEYQLHTALAAWNELENS